MHTVSRTWTPALPRADPQATVCGRTGHVYGLCGDKGRGSRFHFDHTIPAVTMNLGRTTHPLTYYLPTYLDR